MSKLFIIFVYTILFFNKELLAQKEFSFYPFTPQEKLDKNGVLKKPRNGQVLYRGMSDKKIDLADVLKFFLDQSQEEISSNLKTKIEKTLLGKSYNSNGVMLDEFLTKNVLKIKSQNKKLTEAEAKAWAKILINEYFFNLSNEQIVAQYINNHEDNLSWIDWPNAVLFSSLIPNVAAHYGSRVLVFQEKNSRSIDIGFWNWSHHKDWYLNDKWFHFNRDAAEFSTPGYIYSNEVIGLEIRQTRPGAFSIKKPKGTTPGLFRVDKNFEWIDLAFYKINYKDQFIVAVIDGQKIPEKNKLLDYHTCLWPSEKYLFQYCEPRELKNGKNHILLDQPPKMLAPARLFGFLVPCHLNQCLTIDQNYLNQFLSSDRMTGRSLGKKMTTLIKELKVNNHSYQFIDLKNL
jgi:hypothetical protein